MTMHQSNFSAPTVRISLRAVVQEYIARRDGGDVTRELPDGTLEVVESFDGIDKTLADFNKAKSALNASWAMGKAYVGSTWGDGRYSGEPDPKAKSLKATLLRSAWRKVYEGLNVADIAPISDREAHERFMEHPPELTLDAIREHFGAYLLDPREHKLRGLAEQFVKLDPAFRSHEKMKVGVKGLPKRIIITGCSDDYPYRGNGAQRLQEVVNAIRAYQEAPQMEVAELRDWLRSALREPAGKDGLQVKRFMNGNAHLHFSPETLRAVNLALAEYYGDVLPDCPEARPKRATSTAVSKDLQFYRTPVAAADRVAAKLEMYATHREQDREFRLLEPSCGDGALLEAVRRHVDGLREWERPVVRAMGVEYDGARADAARALGFRVQTANFLQMSPRPEFDRVAMNPPFYGKHYQKHVEHAKAFLKPGGMLVAILPISAVEDHGYVKRDRCGRDTWEDLPVGSFAESGTRINTGIYRWRAPGN